jgi:ribosomal protein L37AE/L43A
VNKNKVMTIFEFDNEFRDEISCAEYLKKLRETEGIICKKCGCKEHTWLENRKIWLCRNCRTSKSLKSGTVMENTNLPLLLWFRAIALISMTKKSISSKELQRQLGLKRYQPAWELSHKIRAAMGKRDEDYWLEGNIEIDEGFFKTYEYLKRFETILEGQENNSKKKKQLNVDEVHKSKVQF